MIDITRLELMNAAGWCKSIDEVQKLAQTPISEITVGSITLCERAGNEGTVFWESPDNTYALNSLGLPNRSIAAMVSDLSEMQSIAHAHGKLLRVSIAGFSSDEYATLARGACRAADIIEVNLGCPNVWGSGGQKPIASFSPKLIDSILSQLRIVLVDTGLHPRIAVKVSPYSDPGLLKEVAQLLIQHAEIVTEVVTCNAFPNALALIDGVPAITPGGGFAGMSGPALRPIALGQAASFTNELSSSSISVTGVGGVASGLAVLDFLHLNVERVQVGTSYFLHGPRVFSNILSELAELV